LIKGSKNLYPTRDFTLAPVEVVIFKGVLATVYPESVAMLDIRVIMI